MQCVESGKKNTTVSMQACLVLAIVTKNGVSYLPWSKADQEEKKESIECDPMSSCQDAECKEGRWNPLSASPVRSSRI